MRRILLTIAVLSLFLGARADLTPKYELRGAWLVTAYGIDWPATSGTGRSVGRRQQADLDSMLVSLSRAGINTVFFQVRPMADALYRSSLEPWSSFLTGRRGAGPDFDPLARCVETCHRLGMECHAWINPFRVGTTPPSTPLDSKRKHLWMTNRVSHSKMTIFNPALQETRKHLCDVCREIAVNYDIDGIVFDDYFYNPEFIPEDKRAADYQLYKETSGGMSYDDWRRDNINRTIADVHAALSEIKDGKIRFGISPQGIGGGNGAHADAGVPALSGYGVVTGDSQYAKIYSDPVRWLRDGIVDYVSPQIYWPTTNERHPYEGLCRWWNDVAAMFGRHCFASQTIVPFRSDNSPATWDESLREVALNRSTASDRAPGSVFYSASYISGPKCAGFGEVLRNGVFRYPALIPPMTWKENAIPINVTDIEFDGHTLKWATDADCRCVVYAIPDGMDPLDALSTDADGFQARFILAVVYGTEYALPSGIEESNRIAVVPYDRYGNEWTPRFLPKKNYGNK